jgi:hypothetical protein
MALLPPDALFDFALIPKLSEGKTFLDISCPVFHFVCDQALSCRGRVLDD